MSTAAPTPDPGRPVGPALPRLEDLPNDPDTLKHMILELLGSLQQTHRDLEAKKQYIALLLNRLFRTSTERFDPNQLLLFDTAADGTAAAAPSEAAAAPQADPPPRRRARPHGRRSMPDSLPRTIVECELPEAERVCSCGGIRIDIGVDESEQLDYRPASLFVRRFPRHKYACPHCAERAAARVEETTEPRSADIDDPQSVDPNEPRPATVEPPFGPVVVSAPLPAMPIAKGMPGPGLLAELIVSKCDDHIPLNRYERISSRHGLRLPRSTTCDWLAACAVLLQPLYDLMVKLVMQSRWLHTDDTTVKNLKPDPGVTSTARVWVYLGDDSHPYNVFDFTTTRKRDGPQRFLADFHGYLHADAFTGYDALYLPERGEGEGVILEVACHAHARRKFYEARKSDAVRAHVALAYHAQLYALEQSTREWPEAQRLAMRRDLAVPILTQFKTWLDEQREAVLPKSPMAEAIGYALNQWTALVRYTEAGFLSIDNNVSEREMKRIAIGRKNWLFVGSPRGGRTLAVPASFTSTCRRLKVEPWAYLKDVLTRLPGLPAEQMAELLPDRWQAARAAVNPQPGPAVSAPVVSNP